MRKEKELEEDESILEAEQINLSLSPQSGKGVMFRLLAEVEHLNFNSLPRTYQPLLPTDRKLPLAELLTHPQSVPNYPTGFTDKGFMPTHLNNPLLNSSHFGLHISIQRCLCEIQRSTYGTFAAETALQLEPTLKDLVWLKILKYLKHTKQVGFVLFSTTPSMFMRRNCLKNTDFYGFSLCLWVWPFSKYKY